MEIKTVVLGNEYDSDLIERLKTVLLNMNPELKERIEGIAGSQDFIEYKFVFNGKELIINIETYVGISLKGPSKLVDSISNKVKANKL
ncbi:MAG: hypothetical protein COA32_02590 [Fluviicola sp.]|nr:MAG: hypothetical protein COA32_02590 [Fluviicola sp.]